MKKQDADATVVKLNRGRPSMTANVSQRLTADDVMNAREVAELMHVPVSTIEDWARRGMLPSRKIGRRRLYIRQNIEAVLLDENHAA